MQHNASVFAGSGYMKLLTGVVIFFAVLALLGKLSNGSNSGETSSGSVPAATISEYDFNQTVIGTSLTNVKFRLGEPYYAQLNAAAGLTSRCLYYHDLDSSDHHFQLCFDNGSLTGKARY